MRLQAVLHVRATVLGGAPPKGYHLGEAFDGGCNLPGAVVLCLFTTQGAVLARLGGSGADGWGF